jgi:hypothetical protein
MTALYTYRLNGYILRYTLFNNVEFEELALWVVNKKPPIRSITKKLKALAEKYKLSGIEELTARLSESVS